MQRGGAVVEFAGLHHVHLKVHDAQRAARFYETGAGMTRVAEKHDDYAGEVRERIATREGELIWEDDVLAPIVFANPLPRVRWSGHSW
jgi:catechol 2,3-dioxygenase-like lactoylglutathione lyase family enzyme